VGIQWVCDSAVFSAFHDQLTSLDRHAQLTRCFSAVAELLVHIHVSAITRPADQLVSTFDGYSISQKADVGLASYDLCAVGL